MPRDISGNYTLPPINPVAPQTIIESDWANQTCDDIAAALTDSLSRTGSGGMLVPFRNADGVQANPGMTWVNEPTSGWYRAGLNDFWYSVGGLNIFRITANGIELAPGKTAINIANFTNVQDAQPVVMKQGEQWFESDTGMFAMRYVNPDATETLISLAAAGGDFVPMAFRSTTFGQCYLNLSGANLLLTPENGNRLFINGATYPVPVGGVSLAPAGLVVGNGYFIYASQFGGVISLAASLTAPAVDAVNGNMIKAGDPNSVLVGLWRVTGGPVFSPIAVGGVSYFNRKLKTTVVENPNDFLTSSAGVYALFPSLSMSYCTWADEAIFTDVNVIWFSTGAANGGFFFAVGNDGSIVPMAGSVSRGFAAAGDNNFKTNNSHLRAFVATGTHTIGMLFKTNGAGLTLVGVPPDCSAISLTVRG